MKDIIVFGTGKYFESKRQTISEKYHIIGFLDNKQEAGSVSFYQDTGIELYNPEDFPKENKTEIFLMSVHFVGMWRQLCSIGVDPDRLIFPYMEQPCFDNESVLRYCVEQMSFFTDFFECTLKDGKIVKMRNEEEWRIFLRRVYRKRYPLINVIADMEIEPVSRQFGTERGMPVDRVYIERFLEENKGYIRGQVLEIEDNSYTKRFGKDHVCRSMVMDVSSRGKGITFNGNLETGEGIREQIADCFILTQTLMYIFDLKSAAHNIGRILKPGGVALVTCSGISQNSMRCMDHYGCYFNFNEVALGRIFEKEDSLQIVRTVSYGNAKTVSAHLNGLCREDLRQEDFEADDRYYPLIVGAVVKKC